MVDLDGDESLENRTAIVDGGFCGAQILSYNHAITAALIVDFVGLKPQVLTFGHADGVGHLERGPPRQHPRP